MQVPGISSDGCHMRLHGILCHKKWGDSVVKCFGFSKNIKLVLLDFLFIGLMIFHLALLNCPVFMVGFMAWG